MNKIYTKCLFFTICLLIAPKLVHSQNQKGKEFWVTFLKNRDDITDKSLLITSDIATKGNVEYQIENFTIENRSQEFSVTPDSITEVNINPLMPAVRSVEAIEPWSTHVVAEDDITLVVRNTDDKDFFAQSNAVYLAFPLEELGTEYIIMSYTNAISSENGSTLFGVLATEDNTKVTITPTSDAGDNQARKAGVPYEITLEKGETYQIMAVGEGLDLTGSLVSANKPVAVYGGHGCPYIPIDARNPQTCDHLCQQMPRLSSLGRFYVAAPNALNESGDIYRVLATEDQTKITVVGSEGYYQQFTLDAKQFEEFEIPSDEYISVVSENPIMLAQFYKSGYENSPISGDPFMKIFTPVNQFSTKHVLYSALVPRFTFQYINVVAPSSAIGNLKWNDQVIDASDFIEIPGSDHYGFQRRIENIPDPTRPPHEPSTIVLTADVPFDAHIYAYGRDGSYANNASRRFIDNTSGEKIPQIISFPPIKDLQPNQGPIQLQVASSAGLPVSLKVTEGTTIANISNQQVVLSGAQGRVTIEATQAGNNDYEAAIPAIRSFDVGTVSEPTSLEASIKNGITIYPNPVLNFTELLVENEFYGTLSLHIIDLSGKLHDNFIIEKNSPSIRHKIDLSSLPSGIYIMEIQGNDISQVIKLNKN